MTLGTALWRSIEKIHHVVYFAPGTRQRYEAIGLKGSWMGYFASRSAALGSPSPELVIATFHGFAPQLVRRALPDAWALASREDILGVRLDIARDAIAPGFTDADVPRLAKTLVAALDGLDLAGRPLAAAHASLAPPDDDLGALWHAVTVLREYRGDSHIAVLTAAGLDGVTSNVLAAAAGLTPPGQQSLRGWSDEEWSHGADQLRQRGWLGAAGVITDEGRSARARIEDATDRATVAGIDREATARLITVEDDLVAAARAIAASGSAPSLNPTGAVAP